MSARTFAAWAIAVVLLGGCDEVPAPDGGAPDAGGPDAGESAPVAPAAPAPVEWLCPTGWSTVTVGEAQACEPWPTDRADCAEGEHRPVGAADCGPLGACPAGDLPEDLPASGVQHVLAGAAAGGDGSRGAPFATIGEAVAAAADGEVIAIGRGSYDEVLFIERPLTLRGACAQETVLRATTILPGVATLTATADVTVQDLTIGGTGWGLRAHAAAMTVERVAISGAVTMGLIASGGADVRANDVIVEDVEVAPSESGGAVVVNSAELALVRATVRDSQAFGVISNGESQVTLREVAVRRIRASDGAVLGGLGLAVGNGGQATVERSVIEDCRSTGAFIQVGSGLVLRDSLVRGTRPGPSGMTTGGVSVAQSTLEVERAFFDDNRSAAIGLLNSEATISDLVARATAADEGQEASTVLLGQGSTATLSRAALFDNQGGGVVLDQGSVVEATDLVVDGVTAQPAGYGGRAISASLGARATVARFRAFGTTEAALVAHGPETVLIGEDVVVEEVASQPDTGLGGLGVAAVAGGRVVLTRALVSRARELGLAANGAGSVLELQDVEVDETLERACAVDDCVGLGAGSGIAVIDEGHLIAARFVVRRSALAGLQIARGGTVALQSGVIEDNPVGVNVQVMGLDLSRLTEGVVYRDNGVNLDSSELYIPDPIL